MQCNDGYTRQVVISSVQNNQITEKEKERGREVAGPPLFHWSVCMQATNMVQLLMSHGLGVQTEADLRLMEEKGRQRMKFRQAALDSISSHDLPKPQNQVTSEAKTFQAKGMAMQVLGK